MNWNQFKAAICAVLQPGIGSVVLSSCRHHRTMSATAQRLIAVLAYMRAQGTLNDGAMVKIKEIEAHLASGQGRLDKFLEQLTGNKMESDAEV